MDVVILKIDASGFYNKQHNFWLLYKNVPCWIKNNIILYVTKNGTFLWYTIKVILFVPVLKMVLFNTILKIVATLLTHLKYFTLTTRNGGGGGATG